MSRGGANNLYLGAAWKNLYSLITSWGENSGDYLILNADGSCSFTAVSGTVYVAGSCDWLPSSAGGILTLYYPLPLEPGRVSWSIIWIDQNLMMVNGVERFHRVG